MTEMVTISFEGSITLPVEELDAVLGDAAQAVQDAIGRTGAVVISATAEHVDDEPDPVEVSLDELAEREEADSDRRWPKAEWDERASDGGLSW